MDIWVDSNSLAAIVPLIKEENAKLYSNAHGVLNQTDQSSLAPRSHNSNPKWSRIIQSILSVAERQD